jgi:hypothetical protein
MTTNETSTSYSGITLALCACCTAHGDATVLPELVTCIECGQPCSCEGCVVEQDSGALPAQTMNVTGASTPSSASGPVEPRRTWADHLTDDDNLTQALKEQQDALARELKRQNDHLAFQDSYAKARARHLQVLIDRDTALRCLREAETARDEAGRIAKAMRYIATRPTRRRWPFF